MRIFTVIILIVMFTFCSEQNEQRRIDSKKLEVLIGQALNGDQNANDVLSGLNDEIPIISKSYNSIKIDSAFIGAKKFFSVIVEYPDPLYNFLAVYDENLKFYLLDKSLNGYITTEWMDNDNKQLLFVQEDFSSMNVLNLKRFSVYSLSGNSINLAYRSFSRIKKDARTYTQTITSITDDLLITRLNGIDFTSRTDTFYYDQYLKLYASRNNTFTNFVISEINRLVENYERSTVTERERDIKFSLTGYQITLSDAWREIPNFTVIKHLKKSFTGNHYVNTSFGASITVVKLEENENAEELLDYKFIHTTQGSYRVRSTALEEINNSYLQIFEHFCSGNKYLLIFECPQNTYNSNKSVFDNILDSFFIEC
jgi:hypothetical protein